MTLLSALRAALGASCGPRPTPSPTPPPGPPAPPLYRACASHRAERARLEAANTGLREVNDNLEDQNERLLDEVAGLRAALVAVTAERDAAVAALASTRAAVAALPVHLRAAVGLRVAGWNVTASGHCGLGEHFVGLWGDIVRLYEPGSGAYFQHPWHALPAPSPDEHPALAVIRRAVAGEVLP